MNVFYEEKGALKVGTILSNNMASLQVEAPHGKRSKIKATSVLLQFDEPLLSVFMENATKLADDIDLDFLWECCNCEIEFNGKTLAKEYFGHLPSPLETAAILIKLHNAPMYFYKKGKGSYKSAPPYSLKAALESQKKKKYKLEQQSRYTKYLKTFVLPEEFEPLLQDLLYKPDKNSVEWRALDAACTATKLSLPNLLNKCGAIPSSHDYHLHRFLMDYFPDGVKSNMPESSDNKPSNIAKLPVSDAVAFSIDDADTTEIDDAFSVTPLSLGSFRIGIHIAAPSLGIIKGSSLDVWASQRLSTVYFPGEKITMLPESIISQYTLIEKHQCPAVSMYLEVADDFTVTSINSCIEKVSIAANLRRDTLEKDFNTYSIENSQINCDFGYELNLLWHFACKMESYRGKENDSNSERIDYSFSVQDGVVSIRERRRDSPIDKLVSELMIFVNTEWGKQLANGEFTGIYRNQNGGKVKMSTSPSPHQGLGVLQYAWCSSPMRRYIDLINQRQLIAFLREEKPPHAKECNNLLTSIKNFEVANEAYNEFQRKMEKYWCLRWLLQEKIKTIKAVVIKENYVKLDHLPLVIKVPSLPQVFTETYIELELLQIDLLELTVNTKFIRKLES